jgi:cytochrome c biogenesis protein CcmG/thiol:disulfide interchange protein DsbE
LPLVFPQADARASLHQLQRPSSVGRVDWKPLVRSTDPRQPMPNADLQFSLLVIWFMGPSITLARDIRVNEPAPDFHATTFDGRKISLADYKGRVLVINFWATWCVPCREELPLLDAYYALQKKRGLEVIAVTTEDSAPPSKLKELAAAAHIPFILELKGPYSTLHGRVPTNYVIDRRGIVRFTKAGAFTLDSLNEALVPLLREPAPQAPPPAEQADPPTPQPSPQAPTLQ